MGFVCLHQDLAFFAFDGKSFAIDSPVIGDHLIDACVQSRIFAAWSITREALRSTMQMIMGCLFLEAEPIFAPFNIAVECEVLEARQGLLGDRASSLKDVLTIGTVALVSPSISLNPVIHAAGAKHSRAIFAHGGPSDHL